MQFPIIIGLRRSRILAVGMCCAVLLAAVCLLLTPWSWIIRIFGVAALCLAWFLSNRSLNSAVDFLHLAADGNLAIRQLADPEFSPAQLLPSAIVHPWLLVFRMVSQGKNVAVVVFPDSIGHDDFRKLRVWLKWRADFNAGVVDAD